MERQRSNGFARCALTVLLVAVVGLVAPWIGPRETAAEGYQEALVLLDCTSQAEMDAVIAAIVAQGGTVPISFPNQGLLVRIAAGQVPLLQGLPGVRWVSLEAVSPVLAGADPGAHDAIVAWNARLSPHPPRSAPWPDLPADDALLPPDAGLQETSREGAALPLSPEPYQTSEYMDGDVQVDVFLPESNGSVDGNYETWTTGRRDQVVAEITAGLQWWIDTATQGGRPSAYLSFNLTFHTPFNEPGVVSTGYEPIIRPHTDQELWIGEILGHLGYTGDELAAARQYAHDRRTATGRDWGYTIWVVESFNDSDGKFSDDHFGYGYLFGPLTVMTYDNDGWGIEDMEIVIAHETGHIFAALDEYASSGCTDEERGGYLFIANTNCENGDPATEDSIMRSAASQHIAYPNHLASVPVRGMLGWRDSDGDGLYDVIDTAPALGVTPDDLVYVTTPSLTWTGVAQDIPYESPIRASVTINRIASVEYRIDAGSWISCIADDGALDSDVELFHCSPDLFDNGTYDFEIRTCNTRGACVTHSDSFEVNVGIRIYLPLILRGYLMVPVTPTPTPSPPPITPTPPQPTPLPPAYWDIGMFDIDHDTLFHIQYGTGSGWFGGETTWPWGDYWYAPVFTGDFNGDGFWDVGLYDPNGDGLLFIVYGDGSGSFGGQTAWGWGTFPTAQVFTGDFDRDGFWDVGLYNPNGLGNFYIQYGDGTGNFGRQTAWNWGVFPGARVFTGDFNGDGYWDVGLFNPNYDGMFHVQYGVGSGWFGGETTWYWGPYSCPIFTGDFDGDTLWDVGLYNPNGDGVLFIQYGDGTGNFGRQTAWGWGVFPNAQVFSGDFNGRGK